MQVGSLRENVIVALLIYKFGEENVETDRITEREIDARVFGQAVSIKTKKGKYLSGVKISWTVDAQQARQFRERYYPQCDILFIQVNWDNIGGFYHIPLNVQERIFDELGRENYIKLPRPGTNPRGIEFTTEAMKRLVNASETKCITIDWQETTMDFSPYKKWVDLWRED